MHAAAVSSAERKRPVSNDKVVLPTWPILLALNAAATGPGRRRERSVLVAYLRTGAALAIIRVSVLTWVSCRWREGQITERLIDLLWFLRPEELLAGYTRVGAIDFPNPTLRFLFWASLLTVGSFIMATPILFVGWLRQRRR